MQWFPLLRFWGWLPIGDSSRRRFPKADTGADVPGAAGVGLKTWPISNSGGDLQTLVLVTLVASPLHIKDTHAVTP